MKTAGRPVVVYLHRYPIEDEAEQFPATERLLQLLSPSYEVVYFSMAGLKPNAELRKLARVEELPLTINSSKPTDKWLKTILYYLYLPLALRRLHRLKPACVVCKEPLPFVPSLVIRLGQPTLINVGDWWFSIVFGRTVLGRRLAAALERWEAKDWNKFNVIAVTHTRTESNSLAQRGMSEDKIRMVGAAQHEGAYFPVNAEAERRRLGFRKDDWVVAAHGIMHPSKGYGQLIEWWAELVKTRPHWKLLLIGGSGEENRCRRRIAALKLDRHVLMTGWLNSHSDVNKALNAADCLLVTRRNTPENQGVIPSSLFHSLGLGKPTVVTRLPGMCEVVEDRVNGFPYEPDNFGSFKATLEFICDHKDLARDIATRGVQTAKESFDVDRCARQYFNVIRSMTPPL